LRLRLAAERRDTERTRAQMTGLQALLEQKGVERDRVLGLYRKGRIAEEMLERQMQEIEGEEAELRAEMDVLAARLAGVDAGASQLESAAAVLEKLGARLQEPMRWGLQRELVESLVEQVRVDTVEQGSQRVASIVVTYRLAASMPDAAPPAWAMPLRGMRPPDGTRGWVFTIPSSTRRAGVPVAITASA